MEIAKTRNLIGGPSHDWPTPPCQLCQKPTPTGKSKNTVGATTKKQVQPSWFQACHRTLSKKVISNSGFSLIDFCQKNCNSMSMAHTLADHVFFISTNQMQPRCQSCVEFNGGFRGWPSFLLILNPLQAVAKSKCGKLLFSMIATTWQGPIYCGQLGPHVTAPKTPPINSPH